MLYESDISVFVDNTSLSNPQVQADVIHIRTMFVFQMISEGDNDIPCQYQMTSHHYLIHKYKR